MPKSLALRYDSLITIYEQFYTQNRPFYMSEIIAEIS